MLKDLKEFSWRRNSNVVLQEVLSSTKGLNTLSLEGRMVSWINHQSVTIGCQTNSLRYWKSLSPEEVGSRHGKVWASWWRRLKSTVITLVENTENTLAVIPAKQFDELFKKKRQVYREIIDSQEANNAKS